MCSNRPLPSFVESLENEINHNFQLVQSLIHQQSSAMPKSIQKQVEDIINKEKQNASELQALEKLQRNATAIAEEQYHQLEEVRGNITTPMTYEAETFETKNYIGERPKTTSRTKLKSYTLRTLPQVAVV